MRSTLTLATVLLTFAACGQTLFSEDFEGNPSFTLNTSDANSVTGVANTWLVNDVYAGGSGVADCLGLLLDFTIPATASQPVEIGSANGNYLHTASLVAISNNINNCSFGAADGFCTTADDVFARMSTDVSTIGSADVSLKFWWLCNGGNQNYGEVYYSINSGTSWTQVTVPITQYRNITNWAEQTITLPAFGNQATLRFGFRFHNGSSLAGGSDPGFAIDDVRIIAVTTNPVSITASVSPLSFCQGASMNVAYTITGIFNAGNIFTAQLSDASGSFASALPIGNLASVTGGSIACIIPAIMPPGSGYRIRIISSLPVTTGTDNGTNITVYDAPNAGTDESLSICTGDAPVTLSTSGDAGGTWSGPSPVVNDFYDPATMEPGQYSWTVSGTGPCASDTASVIVTEIQGANAGTSTVASVCKNTGTYDLFQFLGGSPDTGGTWTAPGGGPSAGQFNSNTTDGGIYTYTVDAGGSCGSDEAVVTVVVGLPGQAGPDGTWGICSNALPVDLFDLLDVSANPTGVWFSNGAPFDGETDAGGAYIYIDFADQPCSNDTAFIFLQVSPATDAGVNGTAEVCASDPPFVLLGALGGTPQPGGSWTGPGGSPHSGTYLPGTDPFGLYTYTVAGIEPCADDDAVVAVVPCVGIGENTVGALLHWLGPDADGAHLFRMPASAHATIEVMDATGRLVFRQANATINGTLRLDLRAWGAGAYTLRVLPAEGMVRGTGGTGAVRFVQ